VNRKVWLGVAVSALLLWLSLRDVDLRQAWIYTQSVNGAYVVPSVALVIVEALLRALKWQILLLPLKRSSFLKLNSATMIGLMANNVLPARAGEFVRAYAGARLAEIPYSTSLATVVIDRVLDGLTVSALFIVVILRQPLPDIVSGAGYVAAGIYIVTLVLLVGLLVRESTTVALATRVLGPLPSRVKAPALRVLQTFVAGLGVFRSAPLLLAAAMISFGLWITYALGIYFMFLMFGMSLSMFQSFVVLLVLTIALTLPSSPGFVGAMEWGFSVSLTQIFGVDNSQAFALALLYHVLQYIPVTAGGVIAVWVERLSMSEIAHAAPGKS